MSLSLHHECIYHCSFLLSFGFCQRTCVNIGIIITKWYYDFNGQQKKILWWKRIIVCWVQQRILFEIYLYVNFMLIFTVTFDIILTQPFIATCAIRISLETSEPLKSSTTTTCTEAECKNIDFSMIHFDFAFFFIKSNSVERSRFARIRMENQVGVPSFPSSVSRYLFLFLSTCTFVVEKMLILTVKWIVCGFHEGFSFVVVLQLGKNHGE